MLIKEMSNIGRAKYVVSYHDEENPKYHEDGSKFFDIAIFKNRKEKDTFIKELQS